MGQQARTMEVVTVETAQQVVDVKSRPEVKACLAEMTSIAGALKAFTKVSNDTEAANLTDLVTRANRKAKDYDEIRKSIVAPFNEFVSAVNRFFNPTRDKLQALAKEKNRLITTFNLRKMEEQQKAQERARREQERLEKKLENAGVDVKEIPVVAAPAPKVETKIKTESGTAYQKKTWTFEVTDKVELIKAVAEGKERPELLEVNEKLVRSLVSGGVRSIPGVKIFQEVSTVTRGR